MILLGNFDSKLDLKKGRTALPAKLRDSLGRKIILTLGHEQTLLIIPQTGWQKLTQDIVNRPFISQPARDIDRFLLGNAYALDLDDQGRFIIPLNMRQYADLGEEIVFVGMGNRVELWGKKQWLERNVYLAKNISQITEKLNMPAHGT